MTLRGRICVGTCERQMCRIGLQCECCSFFRSGQVNGGNERGVWARLRWPFHHAWHHLKPDTAQRSRAKANGGRMIWVEFADKVSQRGEGRKRKWNSTQRRNKSFDQCGSLKVSFSTDWRYKHLKLDLSYQGTLKLHLKCKLNMKKNRMLTKR